MNESIHRWAQLNITSPLLVPIVHGRINSQVGTVGKHLFSLGLKFSFKNPEIVSESQTLGKIH